MHIMSGSIVKVYGNLFKSSLFYLCYYLNYKCGDNATSVNAHLKLALKYGVKSEAIKQSKGTGASGSLKLGEQKKAAKKAIKPKAAKPKKAKTPKKKVASRMGSFFSG